MPGVQKQPLDRIPSDQLLVDPTRLAAVLAEGTEDGVMPVRDLYVYLAASILLTVAAAVWWAAQ